MHIHVRPVFFKGKKIKAAQLRSRGELSNASKWGLQGQTGNTRSLSELVVWCNRNSRESTTSWWRYTACAALLEADECTCSDRLERINYIDAIVLYETTLNNGEREDISSHRVKNARQQLINRITGWHIFCDVMRREVTQCSAHFRATTTSRYRRGRQRNEEAESETRCRRRILRRSNVLTSRPAF